MQGMSGTSGCVATSSRWIWKRLFSARSTRSSADGAKRHTCRQISEPMEPPAPDTMTTRPFIAAEIASMSSFTGSRPRRSSIATLRSWLTVTRPSMR